MFKHNIFCLVGYPVKHISSRVPFNTCFYLCGESVNLFNYRKGFAEQRSRRSRQQAKKERMEERKKERKKERERDRKEEVWEKLDYPL